MSTAEFSFNIVEGQVNRVTVHRVFNEDVRNVSNAQLHYIDLDQPLFADALIINTENTRAEFGIAISFDSLTDKWRVSRVAPGENGTLRLIKVFEMPV